MKTPSSTLPGRSWLRGEVSLDEVRTLTKAFGPHGGALFSDDMMQGCTYDVVVVDGPTVGDLGEITVDVVGFPDDSVLGARLRVFAEPDPGGESFTVRTVESTTLCRRAVSEGLCV